MMNLFPARPMPRVIVRGIAAWLPLSLVILAFLYLVAALTVEADGNIYRAALLPPAAVAWPLRLFLLAIAPALAAFALLWAERALTDLRLRLVVRTAAVLGAGIAVITLAGGWPT